MITPASVEKLSEAEILQKALSLLEQRTGLAAGIQAQDLVLTSSHQMDALIFLRVGRLKVPFFVEVKKGHLTKIQQIQSFLLGHRNVRTPTPWMLVAEGIAPTIRDVLRKGNVGFVDLAGNIFVPIRIESSKDPLNFVEEKEAEKPVAYKPKLHSESTMRLVFCLLSDQATLEFTQRALAERAELSPGMVNRCLSSLEHLGFLARKSDGGRMIRRREELISRWSMLYSDHYRERLLLGRFKRVKNEPKAQWFKSTKAVQSPDFVWGGEAAGALYTRHLEPELFTIYTRRDLPDVLTTLRLSPSAEGDVFVYKAFWGSELDKQRDLAPPLIAYADLMGSGFERNRETAGMIYEQCKLGN